MYRVYFNKHNAENGFVWSVDKGTQESEINVKKVVIRGVAYTASGPGDNLNSPTVWLAIDSADLHVIEDIAYIMPKV